MPVATPLVHHRWSALFGVLVIVICYTPFYISTIFPLSYDVGMLYFSRLSLLGLLCLAVMFMGLVTPLPVWAPDCSGRKPVPIVGITATILSGLTMAPLPGSGQMSLVTLLLIIRLFLMGMTFAPMGTLLLELFPTNARYTGVGMSCNPGGILGTSIAPHIAQRLAQQGGLSWAGMYVSAAVVASLVGVFYMRRTRDTRLT